MLSVHFLMLARCAGYLPSFGKIWETPWQMSKCLEVWYKWWSHLYLNLVVSSTLKIVTTGCCSSKCFRVGLFVFFIIMYFTFYVYLFNVII